MGAWKQWSRCCRWRVSNKNNNIFIFHFFILQYFLFFLYSFCMDLAIQKAKNVGIGWVCANHSNHYGIMISVKYLNIILMIHFLYCIHQIGIAGWYTLRAQEQGLIGISMTNTSPVLCPTRSRQSALGTNPLSVAAPGTHGDGLVLGM